LAGGVAHDFNNLLMLIQGHNERLRASLAPDAAAQKESVGIEHAVTRAASLTGRLLAFSRKQVFQPKVMDLNHVLTGVARMLDRLIEKNVQLQISPEAGLWPVKADSSQIEQLIVNLAVNARDAMPQGGRLLIETKNAEIGASHPRVGEAVQPGFYVMLKVNDNGVGMGPETLAHMFEPFFTTKDPGKGTGLGLAIVYGVVKQLGGWIHVESAPGAGSTFEIFLPRAEEANSQPAEESPVIATAPRGSETILLAEDEVGIRELAIEFLQRRGYKVLAAMDGNEALRIAAAHESPIHLLITDIVMPNMGGSELAKRLMQARPDMKVMFMSGYPDHPALPGERLGGQVTVLQKPFSLDTLGLKIRELLDR
jgi:two-component system, cell cycle sensor histidine kinase and response regulator CckA